MNERESDRAPQGELPDALRWQLRALRREVPPGRDLWPGIAARLGERPASAEAEVATRQAAVPAAAVEIAPTGLRPRPQRARRGWALPLALAAGVAALAIGVGSQWRNPGAAASGEAVATAPAASAPVAGQAAPASLLQREADGMTRQYQAALREIAPAAGHAVALQPAFDELDRNAALILDALAHDPDSRLLLEQLRRTYARRLALTQRVAYT